ncbi:DUF2612 domain-containing protein [Burkholderia seminalis]|uniref:DUF2612 domain-containing protein n=1 Tax=Burkholderia seminalis TaxID=488731 RepID=UPI001CF36B71|nr:DUF2612 domain-containing protein [Burkholderia seminalis]MCA7953839.1 DUF2612 domain-containing protein [Burkholderia seminalis]
MATLDDYSQLITSEHQPQPRFMAVVAALVQPVVDQINVLEGLPDDFDLDAAVGAQLDVVGQWIGRSREIATPLTNIYFSLDIPGLGFDQGAWKGPFDPDTGLTSLDDETYLMVLKAKIAANHWDGTPGAAQAILDALAPAGSLVFIQDNCDMSITIGIAGNQPTAIYIALLNSGLLSIKPEAVRVNYEITSVQGAPLFGFDVENDLISGFDIGSWGVAAIAMPNALDYTFILDSSILA